MYKNSKLILSTLVASTFLLGACGFSGPANNIKAEVNFNNTTLLTPKTAKFIEGLRSKGEDVYVTSVGKGEKTDNFLQIRFNMGQKQTEQFKILDSLDASGAATPRTAAADLDAFQLYLIDSAGPPAGPVYPIAHGPYIVPAAPVAGNQVVVFTDIPDSTNDYYAAAAALKGTAPYANITAMGASGKMEDGQRVFVSGNNTSVVAGALSSLAPLNINLSLLDEHNAFIETDITVNDGTAGAPPAPNAF